MKTSIFQDNQEKKSFFGENSQNEAFGYLLRNQSQSVNYALKYGGWSVIVYNEAGEELDRWKPYAK